MSGIDLELIASHIISTVDQALRSLDRSEEPKGHLDLVTAVDRGVESRLATILSKTVPHSSFTSEEGTVLGGNHARLKWIADPIDGTVNFARNLGCYSTVVSLVNSVDGTPIASWIYLPEDSKCIIADGTDLTRPPVTTVFQTRGGRVISPTALRISPRPPAQRLYSIMVTPKTNSTALEGSLKFIAWAVQNSLGVRILVSQGLEAARLSQGGLSGVVTFHSSGGWARAASILTCVGAGGIYRRVRSRRDNDTMGFLLLDSQDHLRDLTRILDEVHYEVIDD